MREADIDKHLVRRVKEIGGRSWKWESPTNRGVPDRIVFFPGQFQPRFVELKAPGKTPTKLQSHVHNVLRDYNQSIFVLSSKEAVDAFIESENRKGL